MDTEIFAAYAVLYLLPMFTFLASIASQEGNSVLVHFTLNNFCEAPKYEHFLSKLSFLVTVIA